MANSKPVRKNEKVLDDFIHYCKANPELRFWQALRNWSGWSFLVLTNDDIVNHRSVPTNNLHDPFSWEGKERP